MRQPAEKSDQMEIQRQLAMKRTRRSFERNRLTLTLCQVENASSPAFRLARAGVASGMLRRSQPHSGGEAQTKVRLLCTTKVPVATLIS